MSAANGFRQLPGGAGNVRERFSATARRRRQRPRTVFGDCQEAAATPANGFRQLPGGAGNARERFSATARRRRQRPRTVFGNCQKSMATGVHGAQPIKNKRLGIEARDLAPQIAELNRTILAVERGSPSLLSCCRGVVES
ncbi:MAG TPA: hypothetical protein VGG06_34505 [Thermoanaerobaculia bacterium]|jgi:hypothetical protein